LAVNFKGGFKVIGVPDKSQSPVPSSDCEPVDCESVVEYETVIEHLHPLSSEEIRFLLMFLKKSTFTGGEMENLVVVTMKLQEEYQKVLDKEQKK